jgi:FtsZ-binding cell division protein ZapB
MNYSCEEEYNEAMGGQAEAEMMAQQAKEIFEEVNKLEAQKQEIQDKIDSLLGQLP